MPILTLGSGESIFYVDPNPSGKVPVLLLHGLGVTSESWMLQFPPLCEAGFRPIAPDVPGFGQSPYVGRRWSIGEVASTMTRFVKAIDPGIFHVVGISMGGVIAQQIALESPNIVDRLVLVNTFARLWPKSVSGWAYFVRRFFVFSFLGMQKQAELVSTHLFPNPDQAEYRKMLVEFVMKSDRRVYRRAMFALVLFNSTSRLATLNKPTLVITGEKDKTVPFENQRMLMLKISGARQVLIPDASHAVTIDQAERFNSVLLEFLTHSTQ